MRLATSVQPEQVQSAPEQPPLFYEDIPMWQPPQAPVSQAMPLDGPGPMVSASHPIESHHAADVAARTAVTARHALLCLLAEIGPVDASEFQTEYHRVYLRRDWPRLGDDSPRKRLQDLANKYGLAERFTDGHVGANGLPKGLYRITDAGWDELRKATS